MKINKSFLKSTASRLADAALAKLSQKSTIAGIVTFVATALGCAVDPSLAGTIASVGATVASGLLVLFDEKVKPAEASETVEPAETADEAHVETSANSQVEATATTEGEAH